MGRLTCSSISLTYDYVGIDIDAEYVTGARSRYGDRATFRLGPLVEDTMTEEAHYDLVLAWGVLHHLDDDRVTEFTRPAVPIEIAAAKYHGFALDTCATISVGSSPRNTHQIKSALTETPTTAFQLILNWRRPHWMSLACSYDEGTEGQLTRLINL